ncbi:hypothetical protein AVEN_97691-1 [Araneus ventricosus]|uniref:Histone-lysine N-methyltransferase SETMAR n=1 Tax=Araneus ventricosus TaxID=182803 RepID=A0A4Y2PTH2_ARAVE|nr:hypothetical protein AVEN_97691-1 [Araneus ventricosus]
MWNIFFGAKFFIAKPQRKVGLWKKINVAVSCQYLRRLGRAILTFGVVLIHDNARPHSAVLTQQLLKQFKWDVSNHPTYIPDLATSDFHLFPELNWLEGQSFQTNEKIQSNVMAHLTSLAGMFFGNLVHRCDKCQNLHGDNVKM